MIDIVMSGMCKDCKNADLEVDSFLSYALGGTTATRSWQIRCTHEAACKAMQKKLLGEKPKEISYTAEEFCVKLKDFIRREQGKRGEAE